MRARFLGAITGGCLGLLLLPFAGLMLLVIHLLLEIAYWSLEDSTCLLGECPTNAPLIFRALLLCEILFVLTLFAILSAHLATKYSSAREYSLITTKVFSAVPFTVIGYWATSSLLPVGL
jgi:hypothetical protein